MDAWLDDGTDRDAPIVASLADVTYRPVFIIGPHRSGTTILAQVLLATGCFNGVTTYHILNQHRLLHLRATGQEAQARREIDDYFRAHGIEDRVYDRMATTAEMPEEYCFALRPQQRHPLLTSANLTSFDTFCRKVQALGDADRPLLLKSPFDTTNFLFLARSFPDAKFVFIHRHPAEIISSQLYTIRSILAGENRYLSLVWTRYRTLYRNRWKVAAGRWLYSDRFPLLFELVRRGVARNCDYITAHIDAVRTRACSLTYAELCESPDATVDRVLRALSLQRRVRVDLAQAIHPRPSRLEPRVAQELPRIESRSAEYTRRFNIPRLAS
ncbi:MAG TPA: sulfotransferase [Vicinamibacterales bacterium]